MKKPKDINEIAHLIAEKATTPAPTLEEEEARLRSEAAAILGRLGGKKGGPARAKALSARRRREIAEKAIKARWAKAKKRKTSKL